MNEHPILFSRPMILAILNNSKTQTRRIMSEQPVKPAGDSKRFYTHKLGEGICDYYFDAYNKGSNWCWWTDDDRQCLSQVIKCPFGKVGDRLWVRETWGTSAQWNSTKPSQLPFSRANGNIFYAADYEEKQLGEMKPWRPSIFLPRRYSRICLEITEIRVEKLLEISDKDAISEGIEKDGPDGWRDYIKGPDWGYGSPQNSFFSLWNSINGEDAHEANPYLWCLSFKRIEAAS